MDPAYLKNQELGWSSLHGNEEFYHCKYCESAVAKTKKAQHKSSCFENPRNIIFPCHYCDELSNQKDIDLHLEECLSNPKNKPRQCAYCGKEIEKRLYGVHVQACKNAGEDDYINCEYCHVRFPLAMYDEHLAVCSDKEPEMKCEKCHKDILISFYEFHYEECSGAPSAKQNRANEEESKDQECTICFADFKDGSELKFLECTHKFHRRCVDAWLQNHNTCPVCRVQVSE